MAEDIDIAAVLGRNVRRLRSDAGMRQRDLARRCQCGQSYISALERGLFWPSVSTLLALAMALDVAPSDLMQEQREQAGRAVGIPVINRPDDEAIPVVLVDKTHIESLPGTRLRIPDLSSRNCFAAYLPDMSMVPPFEKGELVVFSLTRDAADGDVALVDVEGQAVFRTVWELPDGQWRLQPSNPRYEPRVIGGDTKMRMWPAIGRWQRLRHGRAGRAR